MKIPKGWDFAGWAAKYNVLCTDGTTIKPGFGDSQNGAKVPLMWNHNHDSIGEVLGHAILEARPEGIYCYAYCNKSEEGQKAIECVGNGDIDAFSIWANNLKRKAGDIFHGADPDPVTCVFCRAECAVIITGYGTAAVSHDQ